MTRLPQSAAGLGRSGWVPAVLVVLLTVTVLRVAGAVPLDVQARFAGYLLVWLVLPGTLAWRAVRRDQEPRPLVEDLAFGALVGVVLEFPVYLVCLAAGHPRYYLLWPVIVVAASLATPATRRLWTLPRAPLPPWFSWSLAGAMAYAVAWFGHHQWATAPVRPVDLRNAYIDEPFHLSVAAGLRHHFPPEITYVAGTPLDYHFLSHLHVAAASWVSGVEPVILLRALSIPTLVLVVALAAAMAMVRLTGSAWTGPVTVALVACTPFQVLNWDVVPGEGILNVRLVQSPSAGFVNVALLVGLVLCLDALRGRRLGWPGTLLLTVTFVAMAGAKSTSLPTVAAGLLGTALVVGVRDRRVPRVPALLAGLSVVSFVIAKFLFFGSGTHGLFVEPLAYLSVWGIDYPGVWEAPREMSPPVTAIATVWLLGFLTLIAPALALLPRRGWQQPETLFLGGTVAAGIGAGLTFHQFSYSEYYFMYVVLLPMVLAAVLGLHRLAGWAVGRGLTERRALATGGAVVGVSAVAYAVLGLVLDLLGPGRPEGGPVAQAVDVFLLPTVALAVFGVVLSAALVVGVARTLPTTLPGELRTGLSARRLAAPVALLVVTGWGAAAIVQTGASVAADPVPAAERYGQPLVGRGGLEAARWLRRHTRPDALVATNAHCQIPRMQVCSARNFWMAGYTERRFLVEGWSYISRTTVGLPAPPDENTTTARFWDPKLLVHNDRAFTRPSRVSVGRLREEYGVRWLLVDKAYRVDLRRLQRNATPVFERGRYVVFDIRQPR